MKPIFHALIFSAILFLNSSCVLRPSLVEPILIVPKTPLGDGGKILRDLYRSYWWPPQDDSDVIRVGIIPSAKSVSFSTLEEIKMRIYSEQESFEILSPKNVQWNVSYLKELRPAIIHYMAAVSQTFREPNATEKKAIVASWAARGFSEARWVGPPAMDQLLDKKNIEKWFVSLTNSYSKHASQVACSKLSKLGLPCRVLARTELPPVIRVLISASNSNFQKEFTGYLEMQTKKRGILVNHVSIEPRTFESTKEDYDEKIYVLPTQDAALSLVQELPFEKYLKAVVPSETFASGPIEAVKSQAVIARTYAIRHEDPMTGLLPYHICSSTLCQVYRGNRLRHSNTDRAVNETKDLIVWSDGNMPAQTFYHSICGGSTESAHKIHFSSEQSYLQSVSDWVVDGSDPNLAIQERLSAPQSSAYCGKSKFTNSERWAWERHLTHEDITKVLSRLNLSGKLKKISPTKRGNSGRIFELYIETTDSSITLTGEYKIRNILGGLLSSLINLEPHFTEEQVIDAIDIHGKGYGHGVGLCQMGAIGRAEAGFSFKEILNAYYPNTITAPLSLDSNDAKMR